MHDMKSSHYVVYQLELKQKLPDRKTCTRAEGDFASSKGGGAITAAPPPPRARLLFADVREMDGLKQRRFAAAF